VTRRARRLCGIHSGRLPAEFAFAAAALKYMMSECNTGRQSRKFPTRTQVSHK